MPKVTLKVSCPCSSAPPVAPQTAALQRMAADVAKLTNGAVTMKLYLNSSLVPQSSELQSLRQNTAQMIEMSGDEYQSIAGAGMIYQIPYVFTDFQQELQLNASPEGQELLSTVDKALGVHILGMQDLGSRELDLTTTKAIEAPADMKGIKLRVPSGPYWATLGQALGGSVTPVDFSEIYLSLQTGVIQAQDNPLPTDVANKFYEVTKQIVLTNHVIEPVMPTINATTWNKLSPAEQSDLEQAVASADAWEDTAVQNQQDTDITFMKQHGLTVTTPNIAAFRPPALKAFLCNPTYTNPMNSEVPGLIAAALKISGATQPSCA